MAKKTIEEYLEKIVELLENLVYEEVETTTITLVCEKHDEVECETCLDDYLEEKAAKRKKH